MRHLCFVLVIAALLTPDSRAEKAWDDGYRPYQDVAPEYLEIRITQVQIKGSASFYASSSNVELRAEVTQVFRSSTGLTPGNSISIKYNRKSQAGSATLTPPIPAEGKVVPAFLKKRGDSYEPAALHHSFEPLTSQQLLVLSKSNPSKRIVNPPLITPQKNATVTEQVALSPAAAEPAISETKSRLNVAEAKAEIITPPNAVDFTDGSAPVVVDNGTLPTRVISESLPERTVVETPAAEQIIETYTPPVDEAIVVTNSVIVTSPETTSLVSTEPTPSIMIKPPEPELEINTSESLEDSSTAPVVIDQTGAIITPSATEPEPAPEPPIAFDVIEIKPVQPLPSPTPTAPVLVQAPAATAPPAPASTGYDQDGVSAYAMIFAKIKEGDSAYENSDFKTARSVYESALADLKKLKESKPDFQPFIVEYRQRDLARKIKAIEAGVPK